MSVNELLERRNRVFGAAAPLFYEHPVQVVRGEGVWLHGNDGRRYLDVYNNVPTVGHCHPHVVAAIARQAAELNVHSRYLHEASVAYAERLVAKFDASLSMVMFTCTGSEANEVALRIARSRTGRRGIICSNLTYHGNTAALDDMATLFHGGKSTSPDVRAVPYPDSYRPHYDLDGEALAQAYAAEVKVAIDAFETQGIGFAGMLICPIFANEGLPRVPEAYLKKVARMVREAGGLLIFDEVQSGFGRTGSMWGHEAVGIVPDLVTLGKPMGNGHPLAAVVGRPDLINGFRERVMYFNTFGGNQVACAAGMAVLDVIEQENLLGNAADVGAYLMRGLRGLQEKHLLIGDVRGIGLFFGVELVTSRATKTPATEQSRRLINLMKDRGVLISRIGPHDNVLKLRPPLCFSRENADLLLLTLDACLGIVAGELA